MSIFDFAMLPRTEAQIQRAKDRATGGSRKKCRRGKSCGASCIASNKVCMVDIPWAAVGALNKAIKLVKERPKAPKEAPAPKAPKAPKVPSAPASFPSYRTKNARIDAKAFDENFTPTRTVNGSKPNYDWKESEKKGQYLGRGAFGVVVRVKGDPDHVVKRGEISSTEAEIIKKLGEKDIGPKLLIGQMEGSPEPKYGVKVHDKGRIAMTVVPGQELAGMSYNTKINGKTAGDAYWELRAKLHREGIAHNDAHHGNVLMDDKGKARYVDLGLAQDNVKAALSEALGAFSSMSLFPSARGIPTGDGDFQVKRWSVTGYNQLVRAVRKQRDGETDDVEVPQALRKVYSNFQNVLSKLEKDGYSASDIKFIVGYGIRNKLDNYEKGAWGRMTPEYAKGIIEDLYKGVG